MDMPVSQVNIRLFTRLPTDTGIGLLFATGMVSQILYASGERPIQFTLRHAGYALRCKLAPDLEPGFTLQDGQWVRATGHLNFSSQSAQFHLMARDLELMADVVPTRLGMGPKPAPVPTGRESVPDWLAEVQRRAGSAAERPAPAELPDWLEAMAPPELAGGDEERQGEWGQQRVQSFLSRPDAPEVAAGDGRIPWSQLLAAFERSDHEDVELTAETLAKLGAAPDAEPEPGSDGEPRNPDAPLDRPAGGADALEPDSFLSRPYGQLFLLLVLSILLAVVFFLLYTLSQRGFL